MRLPRWLKKPQAPDPIIFTPDQEAKIAELVDETMAYETLNSDPASYPLLITSPTPLVRRIPVEVREATAPASTIEIQIPAKDAINKRLYKDSVRNVLNNKLRSY